MSLIKCLKCGKDISDQALSCPNCGAAINKIKKVKFSLVLIFILILFIIGTTAIIISNYNDAVKKEFMKSCVNVNPRISSQEAICLCSYNYIIDNYGYNVFSVKKITDEVKGIMEQATVECMKYAF